MLLMGLFILYILITREAIFMKLETARDCFLENIRLCGDPKTNPEKFNLYNGLANLAEAMMEMKAEIEKSKTSEGEKED